MRDSLKKLIQDSVIYQFDLPNIEHGIQRTRYSNLNDKCYKPLSNDSLVEIIYNAIIEYSFNEFEIKESSLDSLHQRAIINKLKYDKDSKDEVKLKHGFFGEVMLLCILIIMFDAKPIISRGYFYNILENSEAKGYDCYHLIDNGIDCQLWFGEAKFHGTYQSALKSVFSNLTKALSDDYLSKNIIAVEDNYNNINLVNSRIDRIVKKWRDNPNISLVDELKNENIKLIYPVLLLFERKDQIETDIKKIIEFIDNEYSDLKFSLNIDYSIFFIFIPVEDSNYIKKSVIQWIESRKPLML